MTSRETEAGTPVIEFTREEYDAYLDAEAQRTVGMSAAEFVRTYESGELSDADPAVAELLALLRIGQNGHQRAA